MAAPPKKAFALRLDPAVHAAIERLAAAELRSANAQIEMLLREALEARDIAVGKTARPRRGRPPKNAWQRGER
ncbi:type II toxin-antitoxin system antitoxin [Qipengyuania sp. CAU 1752]